MAFITSSNGYEFVVDAEDASLISGYAWLGKVARTGKIYAVRRYRLAGTRKYANMWLHRVIMNAPDGKVVDHMNGNPQDNRKANLRICTQAENVANKNPRLDASSGYVGVYQAGNTFYARVCKNGKRKNLGFFKTKEEAAEAYRVARELPSEFERLHL